MVPDKIPDLTNMQGMVLVLVLTILKLLHHPKFKPRFHYVPATFPSQPYSDPEVSNSTTTKPGTDIISGKRSLLSKLLEIRCVERCGNVRDLVKKVVLGCKARIGEKVKITRNGLAQVVRKCVKKVTGKMVDSAEKVAKKIEPRN